MSTGGRFLAGVAGLVEDPTGRCLLLRRAPGRDFAPGVWECVTGRLEQGEGFEDALHREMREETGLSVSIARILGTTHFHRGAAVTANELVGVVYLCRTTDTAGVTLSAEHSEARWATAPEASALVAGDAHPTARWLQRVLTRWQTPPGSGGSRELG
ncbi:NUDIX domain-containing protein [Arhodomonas sp. AD133]|uniref:NUDIX domain-containing protein n=1 Tax=Arhodomonas sp. AD133 TaxID=3415009 RepID=UPI003EC0896E